MSSKQSEQTVKSRKSPDKTSKESQVTQDSQESKSPEVKPLPEFTLKNVLLDILEGLVALIYEPSVKKVVAPVIFALTSIIAKIVIANVSYTEIDFSTYMEHIKLVEEGVIDYSLITGETGPMVYPAGHVQIYSIISLLTNNGEHIAVAQAIFGYLWTFNNLLVLIAYCMVPNLPPWPLYGLILSKRLVSIYVLRMFNDCFATFAMVGVTVLLQQASYWYSSNTWISFLLTLVASDLFSWAISIKMNALLYLPGFLIVAYFLVGENLLKFIAVIAVIPLVQVLIGWKYLLPLFNDEGAETIRWNYINQAFDFKRQFLYLESINWKFVSQDFFLSREFLTILLALNLAVLFFFVLTRFLSERIINKSLPILIIDAFSFKSTIKKKNLIINSKQGPKLVLLILSMSNLIGILFARSLHFQFLSWYCWQLPILIYWTNLHVVAGALLWIVHEICWNVYPSAAWSSAVLVFGVLPVILGGVWWNDKLWFEGEAPRKKKKKQFQ